MNRITSIVLLVIGLVLLIWGYNTSNSLSSGFSEFFTGSPSAKAIWILVIGAIIGVIGLVGIFRGARN